MPYDVMKGVTRLIKDYILRLMGLRLGSDPRGEREGEKERAEEEEEGGEEEKGGKRRKKE
jgi:hypothetical protein